jgi:hypothetical protein
LALVEVFFAAETPSTTAAGLEDLDFDSPTELYVLVTTMRATEAFVIALIDGASRV